jgi:3-oxoacyl-[acyl-carrier-protein] synthase III
MVDRTSGQSETGSALVLALVTTLVVSMAVLLVAGMIASRRTVFEIGRRNITLTALADAAMAETLAELDRDAHFRGFELRSEGAGEISSTVTIEKADHRRVVVFAEVGGWLTSIEATVIIHSGHARLERWTWRTRPVGR